MRTIILSMVLLCSSLTFAETVKEFKYHNSTFEIESSDMTDLKANYELDLYKAVENAHGDVISTTTYIESVSLKGKKGTRDVVFILGSFGEPIDFEEVISSDSDVNVVLENHDSELLKKMGWNLYVDRNGFGKAIFKPQSVVISVKNIRSL